MRLLVAAVVALLALGTAPLRAQPQLSDPPGDNEKSGNTSINIKLPDDPEVLKPETTGPVAAPSISVDEPVDPERYVCGPNDAFELNFWGKQNIRLRVTADLEGRVFISKVGFVTVQGKTLAAVRTQIKTKVRGNYPGLQFDLTLVGPRTFVVHVADNVKAPGAIQAHALERVSIVLARAGGSTGSKRRIVIKRRSGATETADLLLYERTGDTRLNPYVLDGDVISVPFPGVTATIGGAVRLPGTYELVGAKDLKELIDIAGGLSPSAARTLPVRVIHRNAAERDVVDEVSLKIDIPAVALSDQDRIIVRSVEEVQQSVLLVGAVTGASEVDQATTTKRLPFVEGDTVQSVLDRAGGITAPGDLSRSYISRRREGAAAELIPIDLEALLVRRDLSADKPVRMNDTIVVPPMQYGIMVEGAVARAGLYPYNPLFGVPEYLAHAGGRSRSAQDIDEVKIVHVDGRMSTYEKGAKPQPGDAILVPERSFTRAEVVQIALAAAGLVLSGVAITLAATR